MKPIKGAVYFLYKDNELVYIGQSNNVFSRIGEHIRDNVKEFNDFRIYETDDYIRLESFLIATFHPKYNKTNGNPIAIDTQDAEKDKFSIQLPPEKVLEIIKMHEQTIPKKRLKYVAENHPTLCKQRVWHLLLHHMDEIPIYRIDHEWFIEPEWYEKNGRRLNNIISRWDYEEEKGSDNA